MPRNEQRSKDLKSLRSAVVCRLRAFIFRVLFVEASCSDVFPKQEMRLRVFIVAKSYGWSSG